MGKLQSGSPGVLTRPNAGPNQGQILSTDGNLVGAVAAPVVTHEITELFSMGIGGLQRLKPSSGGGA